MQRFNTLCYIGKLRIFGKVFPPLFSLFAPVQILWLRLAALRHNGTAVPALWAIFARPACAGRPHPEAALAHAFVSHAGNSIIGSNFCQALFCKKSLGELFLVRHGRPFSQMPPVP